MRDWSQLTKALYGALSGGNDIATGYLNKWADNKAKDNYSQIMDDYAKMNRLKNSAIDVIQNQGKLPDITTNNYNPKGADTESTTQQMGNVTAPPPLPQDNQFPPKPTNEQLISSLYGDIQNKEANLLKYPTGKGYQDLITKFYEQPPKEPLKRYSTFVGQNGAYMIDNYTGGYSKIDEKIPPEKKQTSEKLDTIPYSMNGKDGQVSYKTNKDGTIEILPETFTPNYHAPVFRGGAKTKTPAKQNPKVWEFYDKGKVFGGDFWGNNLTYREWLGTLMQSKDEAQFNQYSAMMTNMIQQLGSNPDFGLSQQDLIDITEEANLDIQNYYQQWKKEH